MEIVKMGVANPVANFNCSVCYTSFKGFANELRRTKYGSWRFYCPVCGMKRDANFVHFGEEEK